MMLNKNIFNKFSLLALILILLISCRKDGRHPVPNVLVNFTINLELVPELNSIGGWVYTTGGYSGIIIYRESVDEFRAFDRACTYHPFDDCAIVRVEDPPLAIDSCCGSSFLLIDGSVITGPAQWQLMQYQVYYNYPYLQISN